MSLSFLHYDVFTDEPLTGNQLAVFPDGRGLSTERMQALAREMNFAESTFILPPEMPGTDVRMRIFTPATEMPMAGQSLRVVREISTGGVFSHRAGCCSCSGRTRANAREDWKLLGLAPVPAE